MSFQLRTYHPNRETKVWPEVFRYSHHVRSFVRSLAFGQGDGVLKWDIVPTDLKPTHTMVHQHGVMPLSEFTAFLKARRKRNTPRPKFTVPEKGHPIIIKFFQTASEKNISINTIVRKSGVSETSIRSWRRGHCPRIDTLEAALNVVGLTLTLDDKI